MISTTDTSPLDAPRPLPRGPHTLSREEVHGSQRQRLTAAMIEAVGEHGYLKTTVADLIARAGVSRKAFYEHFGNKEECFLATYDLIVAELAERMSRIYGAADGSSAKLGLGIETVFAQALENRDAARLVLGEIDAVGTAGRERRERLVATYERVLIETLGLPTQPDSSCDPIARAIVGGLSTVLYTRLQSGRRPQLRKLVSSLLDWIASYRTSSEVIVTRAEEDLPNAHQLRLMSGRAPGTLAPRQSSGRRGLRGEHAGSHSFVVHSQRERVLDAAARLSVSKGYATVTVKEIAENAAISLDAFYEHFTDKEDTFLVAYEVGHGKGLTLVEQAYHSAPDWKRGVREGITALFGFLAAEPAFAHLALVDALIATPRTSERASKGVSAYAHMLLPGLQEAPNRSGATALTIEAIIGGIFELCLSYTLSERVRELPQLIPSASYFALAPFVGDKQATKIATE